MGGFLAELYAALLPRVIMQSFIHLESFLWESLKSTPRNHYCSPHSSRRVMNKCGYLNWLRIMRPDRSSPVVKISLIYAVFISVFILFTHLAVPALSRGTWAFSLRCGVRGLQLRRAGSSVAACRLLAVTGGIWFFDQESDPDPLPPECRVLAAGPPCRSLSYT